MPFYVIELQTIKPLPCKIYSLCALVLYCTCIATAKRKGKN